MSWNLRVKVNFLDTHLFQLFPNISCEIYTFLVDWFYGNYHPFVETDSGVSLLSVVKFHWSIRVNRGA